MVILENETLKVSLHPLGAELQSIFSKTADLEYLWNADKTFWPRHAPVLFPIVGGLKDDTFSYKEQKYQLAKHGFARELVFEIEHATISTASFLLKSSDETLKTYPFHFELRLHYQLDGNSVITTYDVKNPSATPMYFSIGAHPAFNVPLTEGSSYEDYYLQFESRESAPVWKLDGNLIDIPVPYLNNQDRIPLKHSLFYEDALVFKHLRSSVISILSDKTSHGISCHFKGFPYMGIWAAKDAPFVCIEPWYGIADSVNHDQHLESKEGIIELPPLGSWRREWKITCF